MGLLRGMRDLAGIVGPILTEAKSLLASLEDGRFDYKLPRTSVERAVERLRLAVSQVDLSSLEPLVTPAVMGIFRWMNRPAVLAGLRREFQKDPAALMDLAAETAGSLVAPTSADQEQVLSEDKASIEAACAYLDQLHQKVPFAAFALIPMTPIWTPAFFWDVLRLVHLRRQVRVEQGEARGLALEALARHLTEYVHQRYLQVLSSAELLANGKAANKKPPSYGTRLKDLGAIPGLQALVAADVAMVRNAASHLDRWHLDAAAEKIVIEDGHGQLKRREYSFDEMEALCDQLLGTMLAFVTALTQHLGIRMGELVLDTHLLELMLKVLSGEPVDPTMVEAERQRMSERLERLRARWAELNPPLETKSFEPA